MARVARDRLNASAWRLQAARSLAWALLLTGWIGIGSLAQASTTGPLPAFGLIALWLLALGGAADRIGRLEMSRRMQRAATGVACVCAAIGTFGAMHGSGLPLFMPMIAGWAALVALASRVVRMTRMADGASSIETPTRATPPVGSAAIGALLAWLCVGDIGDLRALAPRLIAAVVFAAVVLALLTPATPTPARPRRFRACRAGLFDCSLPAWSAGDWRSTRRWPTSLASLAMLPMMCGIPWMVNLCRSGAVSPQAILGLHLAAMFLPALLVGRVRSMAVHAPAVCASLLIVGALQMAWAPGSSAWWMVAITHGAAWSVAWATRLSVRGERHAAQTPFVGASFNAFFCVAIGVAVASAGLSALADWHIALGSAAAGALLWTGGTSIARSAHGLIPW